jgi:predicted ATPase
MLKKLTIRNFKAIQDMTVEFNPLTVLIGGNSCGKSTVLQALDFLRSASSRDIPEYLREKGWSFDELRSQVGCNKNGPITFIAVFELTVNNKSESVEWTLEVNQTGGHLTIGEMIKRSDNSPIFSRGLGNSGPMVAGGAGSYAGNPSAVAHDLKEIILEASWLKYMQFVNNSPECSALKKFLLDSTFFGVLSPDIIRAGGKSRSAADIGPGGISLTPFIHGLMDEQKNTLDKIVSGFVGFTVKIKTIDLGGRIELYIEEEFEGSTTRINKDHISDGLLRIISFVAIALQQEKTSAPPAGMVLLDEIENGINPYLTENINGLLNDLTTTSKRQIIVTTHSPIILNDIDPDCIDLLWKGKSGAVHCRKLFSISELHDSLDFLNPGDAWMNIREEDLLAKASSELERKI